MTIGQGVRQTKCRTVELKLRTHFVRSVNNLNYLLRFLFQNLNKLKTGVSKTALKLFNTKLYIYVTQNIQ